MTDYIGKITPEEIAQGLTQEDLDRVLMHKLEFRIEDNPALLEQAIKAITNGNTKAVKKLQEEYVRMETLACCFLGLVPSKGRSAKAKEWIDATIYENFKGTTHFINEKYYAQLLKEYLQQRTKENSDD